ncbi:hypothetical protein SB30_270001 [Klebsiella quasipneumoniae subsp. similipneumoniae]|nr:hypothetical protein SB30_270001 [Klebsiella quasipneumoniae subsp. similipneumoniae]
MLFICLCHHRFVRKNAFQFTPGGIDAAKQVIPTASQCKIGTYVERDIHTPEEKYEVFGHWCRRFYRLSYRAAPAG